MGLINLFEDGTSPDRTGQLIVNNAQSFRIWMPSDHRKSGHQRVFTYPVDNFGLKLVPNFGANGALKQSVDPTVFLLAKIAKARGMGEPFLFL